MSRAAVRRRRARPLQGAVAALIVFAGGSFLTAPAQAELNFDGVAAAYGVDVTIENQTIPLGVVPEAAGPTAQAKLSSLPRSNSFASFPYPGDVAVGVPGLIGAVVPGTPQLPPYPFYVASELGQDPQQVSYPGLTLTAESAPASSHSNAVVGSASSGFVGDGRVEIGNDGAVTAMAKTNQSGVTLGNVLRIDGIRSRATAVLNSSGKLKKSSSLEVGRIEVPGLQLTIPPAPVTLPPIPGTENLPPIPLPLQGTTLQSPDLGFVNGQFTVTLPILGNQQFAVPADAALAALASSGVEASYEKAQTTDSSIVAPTLTLRTVLPAPPANQAYSGPTTVTMVLGRTAASFTGAAGGAPSAIADTAPAGSGSFGDVLGASASLGDDALAVAPGAVTGSSGVSGNTLRSARPAAIAGAIPRGPLQSSTQLLYLVVVVAGIVGTFATQALRLLGVRRWNS